MCLWRGIRTDYILEVIRMRIRIQEFFGKDYSTLRDAAFSTSWLISGKSWPDIHKNLSKMYLWTRKLGYALRTRIEFALEEIFAPRVQSCSPVWSQCTVDTVILWEVKSCRQPAKIIIILFSHMELCLYRDNSIHKCELDNKAAHCSKRGKINTPQNATRCAKFNIRFRQKPEAVILNDPDMGLDSPV